MRSASERITLPQTFIQLVDNENEWFVRVVESDRQTVNTFSSERFAIAFAQRECLRLGLREAERV